LPVIHALVCLIDDETGQPLAVSTGGRRPVSGRG
jgi:hypothetical protein